MIKKYNQYIKESLLDKLSGPSEEEVINTFKDNPDKLLKVSLNTDFLKGINIALENGAKIKNIWNNKLWEKLFKILNYDDEKIIKTLEAPGILLDYAYDADNKNIMIYSLENGANFNNEQLNDMFYDSPKLFEYLCKNVKNFKIDIRFIKKILYRKGLDGIKKLIDLGCFNVKESGLDLLESAAFIGNKEVVNLLLNIGIKIPKDFNFDDIMYDDIIEIIKNNMEK